MPLITLDQNSPRRNERKAREGVREQKHYPAAEGSDRDVDVSSPKRLTVKVFESHSHPASAFTPKFQKNQRQNSPCKSEKKKEGRFKYVLIEAMDNEGNVRHLVRGDIRGT
jgi:hypothetical protein